MTTRHALVELSDTLRDLQDPAGIVAPELPRLTMPFRNVELAASVSALLPELSPA